MKLLGKKLHKAPVSNTSAASAFVFQSANLLYRFV